MTNCTSAALKVTALPSDFTKLVPSASMMFVLGASEGGVIRRDEEREGPNERRGVHIYYFEHY
jgi:hypothetical protein